MQRITRKFWKSGLGSELFSVAIMLTGVAVLVAIVIWFSTYDAAIQSQIVADAVTDGAVAFAQNDMNIAEEPFEIMVRKIYDANADLSSGIGRISISNLRWEIGLAGEHPEYFDSAEWAYIKDRAATANGSGRLSTYHFNFYRSMPNYTVRYAGPRYLDQLVTVSIDASMDIPFASLFRKTGSAVSMTLAKDPYNGRTDPAASSGLNSYLKELEEIAYSSVTRPDADAAFSSGNIPEYGSLIQKVLLEARRYLGDGYARDNKIHSEPFFWPRLNRDGSETYLLPYSGGPNSYKDCYQFVNACFKVDGMSGLEEAQARYETSILRRHISYERVISAADIWREMHEDEAVTLSLETDPENYRGKFVNYNRPWYVSDGTAYFLLSNGNFKSCSLEDHELTWLNSARTRVKVSRKLLTLDEAKAKYGGETDAIPCYHVTNADSWDISDLQVGDVLLFSNPNWNKIIYNELNQIYHAASADDPVITELDTTVGHAYICHYALYIGNGRIIECGAVSAPNPDPSANGVRIRKAEGIDWEEDPSETRLLCEVIRFGGKYNTSDQVAEKVASGTIEASLIDYN